MNNHKTKLFSLITVFSVTSKVRTLLITQCLVLEHYFCGIKINTTALIHLMTNESNL